MVKAIKKNWALIILGLILLVGVFLRFNNTPARYGFDPDAVRDGIIATYSASTLRFPLTGPTSTLGSFRFGPYYYYQIILARIILPVTYAPWIYMGIVSLVVIVILYEIGKLLESKTFGLILAGLAAVSPALVAAGTGLSNPNLIPLHAVIAILLFVYLIKKNPSFWWALLLGIDLGIGINTHYQMIYYFIFPVLLLFADKKVRFKYLLAAIVGIAITFTPLLIFDLSHSFMTFKGLLKVAHGAGINSVPNRWMIYLANFWPTFWSYLFAIPVLFGTALMLVTIVVNLFLLIKKKLDKAYVLLLASFVIIFVAFRFYSGERVNYYLYFLAPFIFIFTGMVFYLGKKLKIKHLAYAGYILFIAFLGYVLYLTVPNYHTYDTRIDTMRRVNEILAQFPNDKFAIYTCRNVEDYKSQSVLFVLNSMGKIDPAGHKIGMVITECARPINISTPLISREITDLGKKSAAELKKEGWRTMTARKVYYHYITKVRQ